MQILDQLATEVRECIGLNGPIEAKVLAAWLGLELVPMPYPCEGMLQCRSEDGRVQVAYYGAAGDLEAQRQIARGACAYLLADLGMECPRGCQVERLAALLCGPALCPAPVAA